MHRHIPQASKSLLALKSNAFPLYTRFQISKFDFKFSMAITVYAVPQQQISLAICGQKLPFASCPKCQQIELCWARIPYPTPFPCPSSPSVPIRQFFSALILLDVAFVHIFNAINSLSEHCFTANRLDKGCWRFGGGGGEGAWLPVSR